MKHTDAERRVLAVCTELAYAFRALEDDDGPIHSSHPRDVSDAIHVVQRIVAIRLAKRADPEAWK